MVKVSRFKVWNNITGARTVSKRFATQAAIDQIAGAEAIPGTEVEIDSHLLSDGLTEKNFDPDASR